jgi:hypothetical protein
VVLAFATPISEGEPVTARVTLSDVEPAPERTAHARVELTPPDAAEDVHLFVSTAWQGNEGRSVVADHEQVSRGVYRTTEPIPLYGNWKSTLRLHKGTAVQGLAVYMPADEAIPVEGIPARPEFTRRFVKDKELLLREQKPGVSQALVVSGYLAVLLVALGLYGSLGWGLRLLQRRLSQAAAHARTGKD